MKTDRQTEGECLTGPGRLTVQADVLVVPAVVNPQPAVRTQQD